MRVRIDNSENYRLMQGETELPFTDILTHCNGKYSKSYLLEKVYDGKTEKVGAIRVRDLLMMTPDINPIFQALQDLRGETYTWEHFVKSRKQKIKKKEKKDEGKRLPKNGD